MQDTVLTESQFVDSLLNPVNEALWIPHPQNTPQQMAYDSEADVLGYGGAAGGGKTDLLLGLAFTRHKKSRIFRRLYTDLDDLVLRGDQIQDGRCSFVWGIKKRWETPDERIIQVGAVKTDLDLKKYKGRPADFIGIDEAVDFPEMFMRFLTGWLRTTEEGQRTRVVMTFNPPTDPSGEWIIQYFAPWLDEQHPDYPAEPGELRWYIRLNDEDVEVDSGDPVTIEDEIYYPQSRTFIPARVEDNPYLMQDRQYVSQLMTLPEPLRSQLRYGNFTISLEDDAWQVIPTSWILQAETRWQMMQKPDLSLRSMGVDPARGGKDDFCIAKLYGTWFDEPILEAGVSTSDGYEGAGLVLDNIDEGAKPIIGVDGIGIGSSVYDILKPRLGNDVRSINVGSGSEEKTKDGKFSFANLRAETWWKFREALDPNSGENIALPPIRRLRQELRSPHYSIVGGKIKVEKKADIRKRIGRSTDAADAVLMAWHVTQTNKRLRIAKAPSLLMTHRG